MPVHMNKLTFLSWNTCRKGKGAAGKSGRSFLSLGIDVAMLQEVSGLGELKGKVYSGMVIYGEKSNDCGIWVARHLLPAVRDFRFGDYWFAIVLNGIIFISTHILDHNVDNGRAHTALSEMGRFILDIQAAYPNINFQISVGQTSSLALSIASDST